MAQRPVDRMLEFHPADPAQDMGEVDGLILAFAFHLSGQDSPAPQELRSVSQTTTAATESILHSIKTGQWPSYSDRR